ncbi:MAG: DinB family protein [Candidatus Kapabacteria bacterium]|nr:DinB family protein [Candidatus Kapabacteria bacterium]MCS7169171.1 DinB family protein [Candidatus Kapabacteria bacterium]MDW8226145.1 DinB family protein [Bacteroidota bacterium]
MEPWLRPEEETTVQDPTEFHFLDLLKSLEQALYWLREHLTATPVEALWWEPAPGIPSIGARVHHVIHASERLATYAFAKSPNYEELAAESAQDWTPSPTAKEELLADLQAVFESIYQRIQWLARDALYRQRLVGRRRIPVRRSVILHHIAEHAAYHAGQLVVLLRLWQAQQETTPNG